MRLIAKSAIRVVCFLLVLPVLLLYWIARPFTSGEGLFSAMSQLLSMIPGKLGSYMRIAFYRSSLSYCDNDCVLSFATLFSQKDTEIEQGVYIGPQCNIGKSRIQRNCLLGSGVHILSGKGQHNFSSIDVPIQEQGGEYKKITIGEDTWIGNGAIIMANVGKKCIIGAGSVVQEDVEDYSIMVGNPARLVKRRQ